KAIDSLTFNTLATTSTSATFSAIATSSTSATSFSAIAIPSTTATFSAIATFSTSATSSAIPSTSATFSAIATSSTSATFSAPETKNATVTVSIYSHNYTSPHTMEYSQTFPTSTASIHVSSSPDIHPSVDTAFTELVATKFTAIRTITLESSRGEYTILGATKTMEPGTSVLQTSINAIISTQTSNIHTTISTATKYLTISETAGSVVPNCSIASTPTVYITACERTTECASLVSQTLSGNHTPGDVDLYVVDKLNTSAYRRTKESEPDHRISSTMIGGFGIVVMSFVFALLASADLKYLARFCSKNKTGQIERNDESRDYNT
ncbi:hypothetical protein BgiMline_030929, partial [Biomphalaria glabrata]